MNVAIDVESNGCSPAVLMALLDIETLAVDFDASLSQNRISDHGSGDGTEQLRPSSPTLASTKIFLPSSEAFRPQRQRYASPRAWQCCHGAARAA